MIEPHKREVSPILNDLFSQGGASYETVSFFALAGMFVLLERRRPIRETNRWRDLKIVNPDFSWDATPSARPRR